MLEGNQISINDYISLSNQLEDSKGKSDFKMTKKLYDKIMKSGNAKLISNLFCFSDAYNSSYNLMYKNDIDSYFIDKDEVFLKLLELRNNSEILFSLSNVKSKKYINLAFPVIKESCDVESMVKFIYGFDYNFDNDYNFLEDFINKNNIPDNILWRRIVQNNNLSMDKMIKLLHNRRILSIMYIINNNLLEKEEDKKIIIGYLQYDEIKRYIITIDSKFYYKKIKKLLRNNNIENKVDDMINRLFGEVNCSTQLSLYGFEELYDSLMLQMVSYKDRDSKEKIIS